MPELRRAELLSELPHDRLGLPRLFPHADNGGQLDRHGEHDMLRVSAGVVGFLTRREDEPALSEHVPHRRRLAHERE